ncbi:hypothetical protein M406DRAFT_354575 [Cryphonectria parasitica EP155]|uniref:Uncharacterized protein n=1 Tax=Cryphonectria parasitica (strain ATCC 38755 / EP155) TaxID=660469 RepID=A0A9P5CVN4_CRYP1|nr:uncharacterized protein M406DRAFT_354575 [Cryphonectria parasitica EP155]KAF3770810.1 hypothetical protein M406DRAFT_354575 [Cryphonectria parasitica EP155]
MCGVACLISALVYLLLLSFFGSFAHSRHLLHRDFISLRFAVYQVSFSSLSQQQQYDSVDHCLFAIRLLTHSFSPFLGARHLTSSIISLTFAKRHRQRNQ